MISVRRHDNGNCGDISKEFCETDFGESAITVHPIHPAGDRSENAGAQSASTNV